MRKRKSLFRVRGFRRFWKILRVFSKHGFGDIIDFLFRRKKKTLKAPESILVRSSFPSPERIRSAFEELGPSFIKLGQLFSTRADIFPPDYVEEFRKLQDQVPPEFFFEIKTIIENILKKPLDHIFQEFDPKPIAAASVAQVHMAKLFSGEQVAVKIVRPGIDRLIRQDIRLMYYLAEKIEKHFELGQILGAINLVKEFERTIFKELDMTIEGGNIEKFSKNFKKVDEIHITRVFWEYTSKAVLVMEYIPGIKVDQVETLVKHGIDPKEIAMIGLRSFSRQLMEFGFFHADPHPGNTLVMYDGRVSLVDFGIMGYLDEAMMMQIANVFLGYAEHDYDLIMEALLDAGLIDEDSMDLKNFKRDLRQMSEPFYGRSLQTISVRDVYDEVMEMVLRYQIRLPRDMLLLFKTLVQTESLGKILGSDASILEVMKPYARRLLQRGYDARKFFKSMGKDLHKTGGLMHMAPKFVHDILKQTAQGRQRVELNHTGFKDLNQHLEKGVNRMTVGLIISASIVAGSLVLNSTKKFITFQLNFLGMNTITITELLGLGGYCIATVLGIWLVLNIFRSGKF
ncbi:MAG: AarF/UbiB family protein [Desulfobacterales bacterium]